jgi:hypothetical protein
MSSSEKGHKAETGVPASAWFSIANIWLSLYLDFFMQNLLRLVYEKILLLNSVNFRGDYQCLHFVLLCYSSSCPDPCFKYTPICTTAGCGHPPFRAKNGGRLLPALVVSFQLRPPLRLQTDIMLGIGPVNADISRVLIVCEMVHGSPPNVVP